MNDVAPLSEEEILGELGSLPGWRLDEGRLVRIYRFRDFSEAFGFMARAAMAAEKRDHHPDWSNTGSRVTIHLMTHDAGGVTELDLQLARDFESLASSSPEA